jgi:GNAT superfamily N-acetyltransferase
MKQTKKTAHSVPETLRTHAINRLISGDKACRNTPGLYLGEAVQFEIIDDDDKGDRLVDAMEALSDYSDSCPFHEWVQYGLQETAGSLVAVADNDKTCGFVVFDIGVEMENSRGIDKIGLHVDLERLYVGGTQRNKGLGKALIAVVASAAQSVLAPITSVNRQAAKIRHLTLDLSGDTLSPAGDRLMKIFVAALGQQALGLIQSGKIAEFRVQDMTTGLAGDEE